METVPFKGESNLEAMQRIDEARKATTNEAELNRLSAERSVVFDRICKEIRKSLAEFDDVAWEQAWKSAIERGEVLNAPSPSADLPQHGQQGQGSHHPVPA